MRLSLAHHVRFVAAVAGSIMLASCSGAETQDVLTATSSTSSTSSSSSTSSTGGTSSSTSSGSTTSSGSSGTPGCPSETEPNDNKNQANVLAPTLCGTLSAKDQKDFLTFRLKATTKTMQINFSGRVRLKVDVGGRVTELTPDNAGIVPFVMNTDYVIEVTSLADTSAEVPWRITVVES